MKAVLFLIFHCLCFAVSSPTWAADGAKTRSLPPQHAKAGVICFDCHQEENPTKPAVASDSCMACHGDYPAMADLTKKLPVNPHAPPAAPHPGPLTCTECHRQHQPPVVKCLECHPKFKLTAI